MKLPETIFGMSTVEIIGLAASSLVLVSFLFNKKRTIRILNSCGCIVFIIYGILINSFTTWFFNSVLFFVQIIYLVRPQKPQEAQAVGKKSVAGVADYRRLRKFTRENFKKKCLRDTPWVFEGDLE